MKKFILTILLIISGSCLGQDFSCPKEIDFGEFNIADRTDTSYKFNTNYYSRLIFSKISKEVNYIHNSKLKILYDSVIYAKGNTISCNEPEFYHDSVIYTFRINPKYMDSISLMGNSLESDFTFYYLKNESYNLDSQTVRIKYRFTKKKVAFILKEQDNFVTIQKKINYGDSSNISFDLSYLVNFYDKNLIIDSVKQIKIGSNYFHYSVNNTDTLKFPFLIKSRNRVVFKHFYRYLNKEIGRSIVDFYCHLDKQNDLIVISDSSKTIFDDYNGFYINISDPDLYSEITELDTVKMKIIRISNFTDSAFVFVSTEIKTDNGLVAYIKYQDNIPPFSIPSWSGSVISNIFVNSQFPGKFKMYAKLNFETVKGDSFYKILTYTIDVYKRPTSIIDFNPTIVDNILILPNPASDYIEISLSPLKRGDSGVSPVRIFDLLGVEITTLSNLTPALSKGEGAIRIDVSGLLPGVYFVRVGNEVRKFVKM